MKMETEQLGLLDIKLEVCYDESETTKSEHVETVLQSNDANAVQNHSLQVKEESYHLEFYEEPEYQFEPPDTSTVCENRSNSDTENRKKLFQCKQCKKCFTRKWTLLRHLKLHTVEKPFQCPESNNFSQKSKVVGHVRTTKKRFQCEECQKCYKRRSSLNSHLQLHSSEKRFQCSMCETVFTQKGKLVNHLRIHSGEKPFQCAECNKNFTEKGHLTRHLLIHTGEKPFQCKQCGKNFAQKSHLQSHLFTHTDEKPFQCPECSKCFRRKWNVVMHLRTHLGEKPFQCTKCVKNYTEIGSLVRHDKQIHNGEKYK